MNQVPPYPTLFSPTTIGGVPLRNRLAHASIVSRFIKDGRATDRLYNYMASRARGGAGLLITEPVAMTTNNRNPDRLRGWDDGALDDLKRLVGVVERWDSRLLGQVQDPGRGRHATGRNDFAIGASPLPDDLSWTVPHALEPARIRQLIDEWAAGCRRLQAAGFSGVEISSGHGHLFHQFLSPWSNRRTDDYGGDTGARTRFLRELIGAIRGACGRPFIIGLKLPGFDGVPGSIDHDEARRIAVAIAATGNADYWTFVWGAHARSLWLHMPGPAGPRAPYLPQIRELRQADPSIPTGAIGYITDPNEAERALTDGTADLVFLGRPLITDAAWGEKARTGREGQIRYCVSCNTCWRTVIEGTRLECDNNPRVGEPDEVDWQPAPAPVLKDVAVIGSGVAGLEAAWVAAARGHRVTLYGAADEPGGKTRLHAELPGGEHLSSIYDFQQLACRQHGVRLKMGTEVDAVLAAGLKADVVILATGSTPSIPAFIPPEYVADGLVQDLRNLLVGLRGRTGRESGRLVLVDQDHTEMTYGAALKLLDHFTQVTIVTARERIAADVALLNRQAIYQQLHDRRVQIITGVEARSLDGLEDGRLTLFNVYNGDPQELADVVAVTFATSRVPDDQLRATFEAAGREVHLVGDCYAPRSVLAATRQGYEVGMTV
ncbi:MAG: FAD-dependent oxidoreductase [Gammaproteobacteria bacterium]